MGWSLLCLVEGELIRAQGIEPEVVYMMGQGPVGTIFPEVISLLKRGMLDSALLSPSFFSQPSSSPPSCYFL